MLGPDVIVVQARGFLPGVREAAAYGVGEVVAVSQKPAPPVGVNPRADRSTLAWTISDHSPTVWRPLRSQASGGSSPPPIAAT